LNAKGNVLKIIRNQTNIINNLITSSPGAEKLIEIIAYQLRHNTDNFKHYLIEYRPDDPVLL
jgi:hypothetical protein